MIEAGVPCVPGSVGILESFEQTQEIAKSFGYPVCLKQLQVVVEKECSLERRRFIKGMGRRSSRVSCCFGNDGMYLEKLIEEPRHIEILL
jgi:acetyl-CoA carboxylase biotin carboxylase subunit